MDKSGDILSAYTKEADNLFMENSHHRGVKKERRSTDNSA
jgi:hypothetical protein